MTFKEKVLKAMSACPLEIDMPPEHTRRELLAAVEKIPDEAHENVRCAAPNYEAMYHDAMKEKECLQEQVDFSQGVIDDLRRTCARLEGFREAVHRIFPDQDCCHGLR